MKSDIFWPRQALSTPQRWARNAQRFGKRATYRLSTRIADALAPARSDRAKAYWWRALNFGDLLTPALLSHYNMPVSYAHHRQQPDVVGVGSYLDFISQDFSGFFLGTGFIGDGPTRTYPKAEFLAIRGQLSKNRASVEYSTILGDLGLLAHELIDTRSSKRYALGFVPHRVEKDHLAVASIVDRNRGDLLVIDVERSPKQVIQDIDQCEAVISSSLHGLVIADALGIPTGWVTLTDNVKGAGFKFYDYHSAFGTTKSPLSLTGDEHLGKLVTHTTRTAPDEVARVQEELAMLLRTLPAWLENKQKAVT